MNMMEYDENDNGEDVTSAKKFDARKPGPLTARDGLVQGATRRVAFWVSSYVPDDAAYIVDSNELVADKLPPGGWPHKSEGHLVPHDTLLVLISPVYEERVRKAMATWQAVPHPAQVAAKMIDQECRKDPTLAARLRWKVLS